jgi:hypothetical protein
LIVLVYKTINKLILILWFFRNYFKGYLFVDIFTSLPYDYITIPWRKIPEPEDEFIIATLLNLIPLLKCSRYFTFRSRIKQTFLVTSFLFYFHYIR